ncbi:MAG: hypothetical protein ACP5NV_00365 [Candidatus Woesearchaeota archaeon]
MEPIKACNMCGTTSNDTAIFSTTYAKGDMNICLQCLTEGVLEITKEMHKTKKVPEIKFQEFPLEGFDLTIPQQVFGFNCEKCGDILFSEDFPVLCDCGHENHDCVIKKQDILNETRRK